MLFKPPLFGLFSRVFAAAEHEKHCHRVFSGIYLLKKAPRIRRGKDKRRRSGVRKAKGKGKMANCLITFRSATYSMKARLALSRAGIAAREVKPDAEYTGRGCTHGLRIDCRMRRNAEAILRDGGIPYSAVVGS